MTVASPEFRLFNTMTRQVEPLAPADGETVRFYSCGPTVYNPAHFGNFRTFLFNDLLRRALRRRGWKVRQVMNLTDVDDKIIKRAHDQGKTIREITEPVTAIFHADREYLRIEPAESYPKATEYIPQMIALVERLVERGIAYRADDGSGLLCHRALSYLWAPLAPGHARDQGGCAGGPGRLLQGKRAGLCPLEGGQGRGRARGCGLGLSLGAGAPRVASRMLGHGDGPARTYPRHPYGGIDLIFPHHEDEIAQSEAATGLPFANCWCHGAFLLTDGAKMAKRRGNVSTVEGLRKEGVSAAALRHFVFNTHYRKELNFSDEALDASTEAVRRIGDFAERLGRAEGAGTPGLAAAAQTARWRPLMRPFSTI